MMTALVVGIPVALYALRGNPLPDTGTDLSALADRLTAPDTDGSLFLGALTWIGWIAWASLAFTVLVEVVAQLRGLPTPHLPALGPQQRIAAGLVATTALLFAVPFLSAAPALAAGDAPRTSTGPSVAAPASPVATVNTTAPSQDHARPATASTAASGRTYAVQPGDTLWQIAQDHLGDGTRFTEIAQLNYGVPQADGHALTAAHWLTPGWKLTLPAPPAAGSHTESEQTVVVKLGDTLWQIAQDHLGDGDRYPDIAAASTELQADGTRLVDPDLIRTGWTLHLPTDTATDAAPPVDAAPPAPHAPATPTVPPDAVPPAVTPPAEAPRTEQVPSAAQAPSTAPAQTPAAQQPPAAASADPVTSQDPDVDHGVVTVRTAGGVGALLAASMLSLLGLKRTRQQRRRRPGQRIAMPPPDLHSAELGLRMIEDPTGLDRVDQALRSLSVLLAEDGQPLPRLRLARLVDEDLELYLDGAMHLPAPFAPTGDPTIWTLEAEAPLLSAEELADVPGPFPSLVTIGHDLDNAHVLLDLEHAAALTVDGSPEASIPVLAAIAAELATSRWAEDLTVTVVGCLPQHPDAIGTGRVRYVDTLAQVLPALEKRAAGIRRAMTDLGLADLQHARSAANQGPYGDVWYPEILLLGGPVDSADRDRLHDLMNELPQVSLAAVTAADSTPSEWTLVLDPIEDGPDATAVLHPLGLSLRPQRLTPAELDQLRDLLAVAELPAQDLPVDPTRPTLVQVEPALSDLGSQLDGPSSIIIRLPNPTKGVDVDTGGTEPVGPTSTSTESDGAGDAAPAAAETLAVDQALAVDVVDLDEPPVSEGKHDLVAARLQRQATVAIPADQAPVVQVLGPVTVLHARGDLEADRRSQLAEIAAILVLNPGIDHNQLDEMKWPNARLLEKTRNSAVYKLRRWLGDNDAGDPYLPKVRQDGYRFHPDVRSDWDLWRNLLPEGPGSASTEDLAAALELVKGQPFAGAKKRTYGWAERIKQDMISAIGDVAHELARRALLAGNATLARQAAAAGLQADPGAELLWRDALRAEWLAGDLDGLHRTAERLIELANKLGDDLEPETDDLLDELLTRPVQPRGTR